ncbi:MAG TPA: succinate dehydrogenase [Lachnospiraceae bacterium]|nr:succinate dehydrogenase [Lachnospiraceae bacterium]
MKLIFKLLLAPVILIIDLFTLVCAGLISCSSILFRLVSGIVAVLGVLVLITYSVKNGLILLTIAFLVSPMGIPMIAVHLLTGVQHISTVIKNL